MPDGPAAGGLSAAGPQLMDQGALVAAVGLPLLTLALTVLQAGLNLSSEILLYLLLVGGVALVGGFYPALAAAVAASLLLNYFFTPPVGTWTIAERNNALALLVFVVVAAAVSAVMERAARRTRDAARAAAEAATLATLAGSVLQGANPLAALLEQLRETFGFTAVSLLERPSARPPLLTASTLGDRVELHVVDHGPGIAPAHRDQMFAPFQRLGDTDNTTGVGLTMIVSLPSAGMPPPAPSPPTAPPHPDATTAVAGAPPPAGTNPTARQPNGQAPP